jgi:hypothetical protein
VGPELVPLGGGLGGGAAARLGSPEGACLGVHLWLVVVLAYCLPAIVIHRLEGKEQHAAAPPHGQRGAGGANCGGGAPSGGGTPERGLLLQRHPSALGSAAELLLAGYSAWLLVQLVLPLLA